MLNVMLFNDYVGLRCSLIIKLHCDAYQELCHIVIIYGVILYCNIPLSVMLDFYVPQGLYHIMAFTLVNLCQKIYDGF